MPLYRVQSPYQAAVGALGNASQTASAMTKKTETKSNTSKTVGGAIAAGRGGALGGLGVVEHFDPDAGEQLYQKIMGSMFDTSENAAGSLSSNLGASGAANEAMSLSSSLPAFQNISGGAAGSAGLQTGTGMGSIASAAGSPAMAGLGTAGAAGAGTAIQGAALGLGADLGLAGTSIGSLASTAGSLAGTAGGEAVGGAAAGSAAGPVGAAIGMGIGALMGLASYYL